MSGDLPLDPVLLDRYLSGALSDVERRDVLARLSADPHLAALVRAIPRAVRPAEPPHTDALWAALSARIATAAPSDDLAAPRAAREARVVGASRTPWMRRSATIAAGLVIVAGAAASWQMVRPRGGTIAAPLGRTVTASLPDGTSLTLEAGSRVRWAAAFGRRTRDVVLEGAAYFVVVHDSARPFRVHARDGVIEDIGTRFTVRAWPELRTVDVAVEEGSVAVADSASARVDRGTVLVAGQRGRLAADGRVAVSTDAAVDPGWMRGALVFDDVPLTDALLEIGRRFDVTVDADASLTGRRVTARLTAQSREAILNAIALSLNAHLDSSGGRYTLRARPR